MRNIFKFSLIALILLVASSVDAQKQVAKSVFKITTYKADGTEIAQTEGFFTSANEAVATWKPFVSATKAVAVDAKGKRYDVTALLGASEIYNMCKFRVYGNGTPVKTAVTAVAANATAYIVDADGKTTPVKVESADKFMDKYNYYLIDKQDDALEGCPVVDKQGNVIGIYGSGSSPSATDVRMTETFKLTGLSINDPVMRTSGIRVALPADENDALLMMILSANQGDSLRHDAYVNDFLMQFPQSAEGYLQKATAYVAGNNFDAADEVLAEGVKKAAKKDEAHYNYAKVVYEKEVYNKTPYEKWSLQKAYDEAALANQEKPQAVYQHLQAQIQYAMKDYAKAYDAFLALTKDTAFVNGELYYEAAQCLVQQNKDTAEVMAMLDKAVNCRPVSPATAPYYLARGRYLESLGKYRRAILDYNRYDSLMAGRAGDDFYYMRYACELEAHLYQQALNDIAHAIVINRNEPSYYAEMAQLQVSVRYYDDALKTTALGLQLFPDYADLYLVKGLAQVLSGKKAEGLQTFAEAKQHGAGEKADQLIEKYK